MSSDADLTNASRETLLTVIAEQQATISELRGRIGDPETGPAPRSAFGHAWQQVDTQPPSAG